MKARQRISIGVILVLMATLAACVRGSALVDTEWELVSLHGGTLIEGRKITLRFGDGSVEGSGGCNTYGGSYAASKESLKLSGVYRTEMACVEPEGIMKQETGYFEALNNVVRYRAEGERLELLDQSGESILVYVAAGG